MMIPCYVGGKGKAARDVTKDFKVAVFEVLESTGLGYDTRYRYYRRQYPAMRVGACCPLAHGRDVAQLTPPVGGHLGSVEGRTKQPAGWCTILPPRLSPLGARPQLTA